MYFTPGDIQDVRKQFLLHPYWGHASFESGSRCMQYFYKGWPQINMLHNWQRSEWVIELRERKLIMCRQGLASINQCASLKANSLKALDGTTLDTCTASALWRKCRTYLFRASSWQLTSCVTVFGLECAKSQLLCAPRFLSYVLRAFCAK